jgi:hypothetical protein
MFLALESPHVLYRSQTTDRAERVYNTPSRSEAARQLSVLLSFYFHPKLLLSSCSDFLSSMESVITGQR